MPHLVGWRLRWLLPLSHQNIAELPSRSTMLVVIEYCIPVRLCLFCGRLTGCSLLHIKNLRNYPAKAWCPCLYITLSVSAAMGTLDHAPAPYERGLVAARDLQWRQEKRSGKVSIPCAQHLVRSTSPPRYSYVFYCI